MLNKAEKIRVFEIDDKAKNIRHLSGMGARTITTIKRLIIFTIIWEKISKVPLACARF